MSCISSGGDTTSGIAVKGGATSDYTCRSRSGKRSAKSHSRHYNRGSYSSIVIVITVHDVLGDGGYSKRYKDDDTSDEVI